MLLFAFQNGTKLESQDLSKQELLILLQWDQFIPIFVPCVLQNFFLWCAQWGCQGHHSGVPPIELLYLKQLLKIAHLQCTMLMPKNDCWLIKYFFLLLKVAKLSVCCELWLNQINASSIMWSLFAIHREELWNPVAGFLDFVKIQWALTLSHCVLERHKYIRNSLFRKMILLCLFSDSHTPPSPRFFKNTTLKRVNVFEINADSHQIKISVNVQNS